MGYDKRGHCPLLVDNRCSIYEHRPRTCRAYDCRVFPATVLAVDDDGSKALIGLFLAHDEGTGQSTVVEPVLDAVRAALGDEG